MLVGVIYRRVLRAAYFGLYGIWDNIRGKWYNNYWNNFLKVEIFLAFTDVLYTNIYIVDLLKFIMNIVTCMKV